MGRFEHVRRPEIADLMLLVTVLIWSLNFTVTKYILNHGFRPLAYGGLRFGTAAVMFAGLTYAKERSFAMRRRDLVYLAGAAVIGVTLNQVTFIYGTKLTTAATVALIFGMVPILTALFARAAGVEQLHSRFWVATAVSFGGVVLVAIGAKGGLGGHLFGYALDLAGTATWAAYSVAIAPLIRSYTASRISFYALTIGVLPVLAIGAPQLAGQDYSFPPLVWVAFAFGVAGPLVLTNLLWFNAIDRVGPSRASIYTNLQPFFGAVFALLILSESFTRLQVAGGFLIALGILLSRREQPALVARESAT
jgi:drug/metabolite transporter (DMT)-like permease